MTATTEDKIIIDIALTEETAALADAGLESDEVETAADPSSAAAGEVAAAIRIVKGNPADQEIAALVAVIAAAAGAATAPAGGGKPPETWGDPTRMHRQWAPFSPYSYPNRG
ncbi:acyl-CoA carboxylase subunit epsilon [Rhodococcus chondri]|uniref:Acyl-CoA carboxylase subunit epsilon n=1 Tax=Rhodococcus chondri TaxID=3065941 RepID=A0ABU7JT47_9NOCA|nr:acyl-CoA carboxylase subunit epsilon [Rhodococcus sp. CC-R104]MEE2032457.1 acyl-CoA carboxylase subunit epsilon [Rhodococcus sp. CC-R104]